MALVRYHGYLAMKMGRKEEVLEGATVSQLLAAIRRREGLAAYQYIRRCHILVDQRNAGNLKGFRTPVTEGSVVDFVPVCGGG